MQLKSNACTTQIDYWHMICKSINMITIQLLIAWILLQLVQFILGLTQGDDNRQQKRNNDSDSQHCCHQPPLQSIFTLIVSLLYIIFPILLFDPPNSFTPFASHNVSNQHLYCQATGWLLCSLCHVMIRTFVITNHISHDIHIITCSSFANPSQFHDCRKTKMGSRCIDVSMVALWCVLRPLSGHVGHGMNCGSWCQFGTRRKGTSSAIHISFPRMTKQSRCVYKATEMACSYLGCLCADRSGRWCTQFMWAMGWLTKASGRSYEVQLPYKWAYMLARVVRLLAVQWGSRSSLFGWEIAAKWRPWW